MKPQKMMSTIAAVIALSLSCIASADYDFHSITNNNAVNVGIGEAQLSMSLSDLSGSIVQFNFFNVGSDPATIEFIAFDGDLLASLTALVQDGSDVNFAIDASPGNLPGGNSLDPDFFADFSISARPPAPHRGVNPSETLGVIATLHGGSTYADLLQAIADGSFRVGMHVISMGADENSESFINNNLNTDNIPGPAGVALFAIAAACGTRRRRRQHTSVHDAIITRPGAAPSRFRGRRIPGLSQA